MHFRIAPVVKEHTITAVIPALRRADDYRPANTNSIVFRVI